MNTKHAASLRNTVIRAPSGKRHSSAATEMNPYLLLFFDLIERLRWRFPVLIAWTSLVGISEGVSVVLLRRF